MAIGILTEEFVRCNFSKSLDFVKITTYVYTFWVFRIFSGRNIPIFELMVAEFLSLPNFCTCRNYSLYLKLIFGKIILKIILVKYCGFLMITPVLKNSSEKYCFSLYFPDENLFVLSIFKRCYSISSPKFE